MDCETNIVINRLIEEVGELNSPDWCTIIITSIITIINAGFMAWLGWRQYKLQQRQTKLQEQQILQQEQQTKLQEQQILQQEYEIYSKLYKLVKRADVEIEHFLDEITSSLGVAPWRRAEDGFLKLKLDYIEQLQKDLEQNALDFEIKFTKEFFDLDGYRNILGFMAYNLKSLVKMVDEKKMHFDSSASQAIFAVDDCIEKGKAYYIAQHITDKRCEVIIGSNLLSFVERRNKLRENRNDILAKIRERCKVE